MWSIWTATYSSSRLTSQSNDLGDDTLNGGAGADLMYGGAGNDTYVVDNSGDVANETDGDGTDTVLSSISFSLADSTHAIGSIENLTLTGSGAINATGQCSEQCPDWQ